LSDQIFSFSMRGEVKEVEDVKWEEVVNKMKWLMA
jgi:hypothetical protein